MIGTDIVVTVLEVRGEQVRIGIKAPREVEVHREEVFEVTARERSSALGLICHDLNGRGTASGSSRRVPAAFALRSR